MMCALMGNYGRICMPPSLQTMSNLLFYYLLAMARVREPDRICMPSPCDLVIVVEGAREPDRICMLSPTTRVKILAGPSGADRICMSSPH